MSYNKEQLGNYVNTAGKITIITAFAGVVMFTLVFLLNIGAQEFKQAGAAEVATTSVTVLNTPPTFQAGPFETPESSTASPTNSGDTMTWTATALDSNGESYYLLVCDGETASPTANTAAAPTCDGGDTQWGVSALTNSGSVATVTYATTEVDVETNNWFAWVCDAVAVNPRCNNFAQQGTGSTSSPFIVNHRPVFTDIWDTSPVDPSGTGVSVAIFTSTSSDADTAGAQDTVQLHICNTAAFSPVSGCDGTTLATSTFEVSNATATYVIPQTIQDDDYPAFGYVIDNHGHAASGGTQGTDSVLTINNIAPQVLSGSINLNGGTDFALTEGVEDTGFTLDFVVTDYNSCDAVGGGNADEFSTSTVSVFRSGIGSTTCAGDGLSHDENNCYEQGIGGDRWNLQCTASAASCTPGGGDPTMTVECTFPMWFIADPTNGVDGNDTVYFAEWWAAGVSATDDDNATSSFTQSPDDVVEVLAVTGISLTTAAIPYGALEPGSDTGTLSTTTTAESTGNTGLDHDIAGTTMCPGYSSGNPCSPSATSSIADSLQEFGTSELAYGAGQDLSSTTPFTLAINIPKTTSTSTYSSGDTYWGIAVPGTITLAGAYTGENTFTAQMSNPANW
ncbi:hypothetical protein N9L26_00250 [Candidatus Pacebacteria bacterium]|nr:hypothetical protein [Candidatus Paceibacterota bacterium]